MILPLFILLVSADSQKKETKSKEVEKSNDLEAQATGRAYSSVQSSASSYSKSATYRSPGYHGSSISSPNLLSSSFGSSSPHLPSGPSLPSSPYGPSSPGLPSSPHLPSSPGLPLSPVAPSGLHGPPSGISAYGPSSSHRPVGGYGPSQAHGSPPRAEHGLIHDYPQSGHGQIDHTADSHAGSAGGHRKGVEHSSLYGYGNFNNRGPALPSSHSRPSSYHGSRYEVLLFIKIFSVILIRYTLKNSSFVNKILICLKSCKRFYEQKFIAKILR